MDGDGGRTRKKGSGGEMEGRGEAKEVRMEERKMRRDKIINVRIIKTEEVKSKFGEEPLIS